MAGTVSINQFFRGWQDFYDRNLAAGETMKITEIRIDRTKSLGNYENLKLGFTAVVGDDEPTVDAIEKVKKLLDWEINREERDGRRAVYTARLLALETPDGKKEESEKAKLEKWLLKYDELKTEIETNGF